MGFEKTVLNIVTPLLDSGRARFFDGTLFLEGVNDRNGMQVLRALSNADLGTVHFNIYNKISGFVVDFA